uniref:Acetohydroxy-acid reductoisomerase n=1 Tax=Calcidiscus leptoporus TaxID=127549 RepID=A0A7S0ITK0_9EUKA|mmetsp:Transcript_22178/g.50974  ORF Transcript_22178/g.50974 Transcript_22178/m.50974 type:complete len:525 (+) Transcript_22178:53-1627(+)
MLRAASTRLFAAAARPSIVAARPLASKAGLRFSSEIYAIDEISMHDSSEQVVKGGRHLFPTLPAALRDVKQIGVLGWGSQGPAQAQNLRESLEGTGIKVKIGLRPGSSSMKAAREAGFDESSGTLGEMYATISESDMVLCLISDGACVTEYKRIFAALKPGTTLGLSHGFLLGHLESIGEEFPKDVNVVMVAPKGMGPSVRRLYELGREVNGSGINASFAVHQDVNGKATDHALGWAIGVGSPYVFQTTLAAEWRSDIFGERCILLGAVHGMIESLFRRFEYAGMTPEDAFKNSAEVITGPLTTTISHEGILAVYNKLNDSDKVVFKKAYCASYKPARSIIEECYDTVACGNEIRDVCNAVNRFDRFPMGEIDATRTWQIGKKVRAAGGTAEQRKSVPVHPFTAGVYCATMMAQIDTLVDNGHVYSEVVNESVIESVDSLNPYMHARGVSYMVDNCSVTARLGSRKWAPRFDYIYTEQAWSAVDADAKLDEALFDQFLCNPIHSCIAECSKMRPSVDISLPPEN